ncbi:MAG: hypothetical protein CMG49_02965, partial [Candidatus Marinimicrobia bacterium]|nr:hypothetical protein [Candidatus Neomarinimicrobiota bacterium]
GVCGGDAVVDECGVCEGSGIADGACDCDGTLPDTCWDGSSSCELCPDAPTNYPDWDLDADGVLDNFNDYENNGSITSRVYDTDSNDISSMGDMIAAFVGSEQRGIGIASEVPVFLGGGYAFLMMVYSNETSGETLSFKYYSSSTDEVLDLAETKEFVTNMVEGDVSDPFVLTLSGGTVELTINFSSNWNWFSVNAVQDDMGINSAFSTLPAAPGDFIKSQTTSATYYDGFGFYPAFNIDVKNMYLLRLNEGGTMVYEGIPVDPASNPISLATNWNWIGYIPQIALGVTEATLSSPVSSDDYIKSQTTSATYYDGFGFYPSFNMVPGGGYMLKLANSGDLIYPSGSLASYIDGVNDDDSYYRQYEFNGSISASVDIDNIMIDQYDILYAYSDDELRGKVSPTIFPLTGELVFTLMVYGHNTGNEDLSFEFYDNETDKYYALNKELLFSKDMIIGDAYNTLSLTNIPTIPNNIRLLPAYPNPFNPVTNISFVIENESNIKLSIFDIRGREVDVLVNGLTGQGEHSIVWDAVDYSSGIYYVQIISQQYAETQKIMLIK